LHCRNGKPIAFRQFGAIRISAAARFQPRELSSFAMSSALHQFKEPLNTTSDGASSTDSLNPAFMGIGEMARRFDTTLRTLRFYEARGLLMPHREGSNRYYDTSQQHRFQVIDEGRKLGFTLTEIADMLGSSKSTNELRLTLDKILDQIEHLEGQRSQIDTALSALRRRYYLMSESEPD
jgi:DNA-binding transcriptional MerR regulator